MTTLSTRIETITPERAAAMLEGQHRNRKLKPIKIARFKRAMMSDHWRLNGETIKFTKSGQLVDGQNRLMACIEAGAPFRTLVTYGIDEQDIHTIDTGTPRSSADVLEIEGEKYTKSLAGALQIIYAWENNHFWEAFDSAVQYGSNDEIVVVLELHPGLRDSSQTLNTRFKRAKRILGPRFAIAFHYLFGLSGGEEAADDFFYLLDTGDGLSVTHPVYHLRERMLTNYGATRKMQPKEIAVLSVKTWNSYIEQKSVKQLRYSASEALPMIPGK